ncbi:MAG: serine/threonine protein kinase, partial [Nannocystaceae bacterium]|nr:serine/threonine protein kinase [Nannocystaceae bacterium]
MKEPTPPDIADPLDFDRRRSKVANRLFGGRAPNAATIGRYTVLRRLGSGGMAVVYAAYDESLDRRVALKLLLGAPSSERDNRETRLKREAKAMARLSHPNVASVYEIGSHETDAGHTMTFIAMEFVDGENLRRWFVADHSTHDALGLLLRAGEGLAAAHAAGLVHRDFKPENVMIGSDGAVKVVDFGVAAWTEGHAAQTSSEDVLSTTSDATLTASGQNPGTPAYMAPEQLAGDPANARSDQFAYCTTAYEVLTGQRPFGAKTVAELVTAIRDETPPNAAELPRHVYTALLRGLAHDPAQRFASMSALLQAMSFDAKRRWRRVGVGVVVLAAVGGGGFVSAQLGRVAPCEDGARRVASVWTAERQKTIAVAFEQTGLPFASAAWAQTQTSLGRWAADWGSMRDQACEATRVHATQSVDILDRRIVCLDRAWAGFTAILDTLEQADAASVSEASAVADTPARLASCADVLALLESVPLPQSPDVRAEVSEVQARIASLTAAHRLGRLRGVLAEADALLLRAEQTTHAPTIARAHRIVGFANRSAGNERASVGALKQGLSEAQAAGDPELFADLSITLAGLLSSGQDAHDVALDYLALADGALRKLGDPPDLRGVWHNQRGTVLRNAGRYADAVASVEASLELAERAGSDASEAAHARSTLGILAKDLGRPEDGLAMLERAQVLLATEYGVSHPKACRGLNRIASVLINLRRWDEASAQIQTCIACFERALGETHVDLAPALGNYAAILFAQGEVEQAQLLFEREIAVVQAQRGPGSAAEAEALAGLARIHRRRREFDRAYDVVSRAIEITIERRGPYTRPLLFHYYFRASVALALRRLQEAQNDIERFVAVLNQIEAGGDGVPSAVHPMRPGVDVLRGRVLAARGDKQG